MKTIKNKTPGLDKNKQPINSHNKKNNNRQNDSVEKINNAGKLWQVTFDSIPDMISIQDKNFNFINVNKAFEKTFNINREELKGKKCYEVVHHSLCPVSNCPLAHTIKDNEQHTEIINEPRLNAYLEVTTSPFFDENGNLFGAVHVARDITGRIKTEEKLRANEENLKKHVDEKIEEIKKSSAYNRSLLEASIDPLVAIGQDGKITDVNKATEIVTQLTRKELIGTNFSSYFTEPEKAEEGYRKVFADGFVKDYPLTIRSKSGETIDVLYHASVYRDSSGKVQGVFAAARDITERKKADELIRLANAYNRNLLEVSLDPLVTINAGGKISDANKAAELATGVSREELIGSSFSSYFTEPEKAREGYQKALSEGYVVDYPLTILNKSGGTIDVIYNASVFRNDAGEIQGVFAAARDVTELRKAEERTKNYMKELERSNKELEQFAYVASHDLQEPLRMVSSYTQLLEQRYKDKMDSDAVDFINFAVDGANRMQILINSLLAYSRVGRKMGAFAIVDSHSLIGKALFNLNPIIEKSSAVITCEDLPEIYGDETQLIQLFQNLIGNAIKFCGEKRPLIHISVKDNFFEYVFIVNDNGIGIEPQYFERIFVIFQRLHSRSEYEGTGIGLAICKKIAENHNGKIWVESEPGKGSTFYISIPKQEPGI